MTADEYVDLLQTYRTNHGLSELRTDQVNATKTAWNGLTEGERTYVEQRIAAIQAADGALPVGAGIQIIGGQYDQLPPDEQKLLMEDAKQLQATPLAKGATSCSGLSFLTNFVVCGGRAMSAVIGSALITLTAWLLQMSGVVFNWLLYYTVVAFGDDTNGFLTTGVLSAINSTWTVFRDIANILIIGLFTFIAISTILGNHEFGAKKMLAKALIIAVLINFSLLFTKMIIDFSNFTAYQFYHAAGGLAANSASDRDSMSGALSSAKSVVTGSVDFKQDGIAGTFIKYLGITGISNTFSTLKAGADKVDNGWVTLLHGIFSATLLLGTALVLIYGCFLLTARAILVVFLLITSSLAFASYLLPASMQSTYGWSTWWKSLLKSAVFAPLLMMFLWATLNIAEGLRPADGTLGALITDPTNASNMSALFGYIIILGMLFASFKISSSFANTISGFNFAGLLLPRLAIGAAALGNSAWSPVARNTRGRSAATNARITAEEAKAELARAAIERAAGRPYDTGKLSALLKRQQQLEARAKSDFTSNTIKNLAAQAGLPALLAGGKGVGGFAGTSKQAAEDAAKNVSGAMSPEKIKSTVEETLKAEQGPQRDALEQQKRAATAMMESARATADAAKQGERLQERQVAAEEHQRAVEGDATKQKNDIEEQHRNGSITQVRRKELIDEQDERIKAAHEAVKTIKDRITQVENTHIAAPTKSIGEAEKGLKKLDDELAATVNEAVKKATGSATDILADVAVKQAHAHGYTADLIREQVGKDQKNRRLKDRIKLEKQVTEETGGEDESKSTT